MSNENNLDIRAGLRIAYLILNPCQTDEDYEDWLQKQSPGYGEPGQYELFAKLCEDAILSVPEIERYQVRSICFASGYYTAMSQVKAALYDVPIPEDIRRAAARQ